MAVVAIRKMRVAVADDFRCSGQHQHAGPHFFQDAIAAGASGYLLKAAPAEELIAGVRAVAAGQTVLAPSIAVRLVTRAGAGPESERTAPRLTAREAEILSLVAEGLSNPDIAVRLVIGESTVKTHLLHVFEKLEVGDRTRAVTRAMELGLL